MNGLGNYLENLIKKSSKSKCRMLTKKPLSRKRIFAQTHFLTNLKLERKNMSSQKH